MSTILLYKYSMYDIICDVRHHLLCLKLRCG